VLQVFFQHPRQQSDHFLPYFRWQLGELRWGRKQLALTASGRSRSAHQHLLNCWNDAALVSRPFTRSRCRQKQVLQSQQGGAIHMGKLGWLHLTAHVAIEHPLRNLQDGKSLKLIAHALENNTASSACFATNQHPLPMPRMPSVQDFSRSGFMGVSYVGCTMRVALTGLSGRRRPTNSPMRSRLAAISLDYKPPETRSRSGTKKPVRSGLVRNLLDLA